MKPTPNRQILAGLAVGCSLVAATQAQTTAPAPTPAAAPDEDLIVLSPFEVNTTKDIGYLAGNTLAGSRLNTSLKDTGASISVLTPEFISDLGATNMRDVILFSNNAVPDVGDAAPNVNGNPLIGNDEWQLRIRGLPASYARNYFRWETSTDFFNVERIDQARGPNSILFGFGSAGGIVNTTTKQAYTDKNFGEVSFTTGSWDRYRGTIDGNVVYLPQKFAVRVNAVMDDSKSWRDHEFSRSRRGHLATKYQLSKNQTIRAEIEGGTIRDNVARPWLMIDQSLDWVAAGKPTYQWPQWSSTNVTQTWSEHLVYVENNNTLADWKNMPFSYSANRSWSHLAMTPANLALIPTSTNSGGPSATRDTDYHTYSAYYENQVSDDFTFEVAYNHQSSDFLGYDPNAGNMTRYGYLGDATELWGDASSVLPTGGTNPYAGRLYVENNWTRRTQTLDSDHIRVTGAYNLKAGKFGNHQFAGLYERSWRDYYRVEESEVFTGSPFATEAEFDSNRVFRRYYFEEGNSADIRVPTWENALVGVKDPISGKTLTSGWAPNQLIDNSKETQDTLLGAVQSRFFSDRLVSILGYRFDKLTYKTDPTVRDSATGLLKLDPNGTETTKFDARTLTAGLVYHVTPRISVFGNHSNSRDLPNLNQRLIGMGMPPMPKGTGNDVGMKFDLLGSKLYASVNYYITKLEDTTEWGNINSDVTARNTKVLSALRNAGLITAADVTARTIDANGYLEDRESKGWEFQLVANPTTNWRINANFSINEVEKTNIMPEVKAWAEENSAYWLQKAGTGAFLLGGGDWDTLSANIGWMNDYIAREQAFVGKAARGQRKYGANLWTRYSFSDGPLKGVFIGGGGRYQSKNVIGTDSTGELVYGRQLVLVDALVGYETKVSVRGRSYPVEVQLNVNNLLDTDRYQIYTVAWWNAAIPERIGLQEPRKFTLSAKVSF